MIKIHALSYTLPDGRVLFDHLTFSLEQKKYGLVGANGAGKSTLAKFLVDPSSISAGSIIADQKPYYLDQQESPPEMTLGEYLLEIWQGPYASTEVQNLLLENLDLSSTVKELSGGQWMRARLLIALSRSSGFLILDEPTNHLDQEGRKALKEFIKVYDQGLLLISHDRTLLECVEGIWELSNQGMNYYGGPYSFYEVQKNQERERLNEEIATARKEKKKQLKEHQEKLDRQQKRIRWGRDNVESMGLPKIVASARKRQAQTSLGRIHKHEGLRDLKAEAHFGGLLEKQKELSEIRLDLKSEKKQKGKLVCSAQDFNFRYQDQEFLWREPLSFQIQVQERVWIQGGNGSGKSTLMKLLCSETIVGERKGLLHPIEKSFASLKQEADVTDGGISLFESLRKDCHLDPSELRSQLAAFGFYHEDVFKKMSVLSGGERLRVELARLQLSAKRPEILVLDEPTNNLDLETMHVLEKALQEYNGSLIVISHDTHFIDEIGCERVIDLSRA